MLWVKALHVISIIAWMAGLFYLPRLFVYHVNAEMGSVQSETFKVMERRLYWAITTPAMVASWVFGLWLVFWYGAGDWWAVWSWAKVFLVVVLTLYHFFLGSCSRRFGEDRNARSEKFYRVINEVPTLLMVGIIIAVIVRPF